MNDMTAKRVHVDECAGSWSVGRPRKRGIDTLNDSFKKKRFGCQSNKENWDMIGVNGEGL